MKTISKKNIGVTAGAFDLCHAGHMLMFKEAKEKCDHLIVLLHDDPSVDRPQKNRPIMDLKERKVILEAIRYIDEIGVYRTEEELYRILLEMKPDVRIVGADWKGKPFTGHAFRSRYISTPEIILIPPANCDNGYIVSKRKKAWHSRILRCPRFEPPDHSKKNKGAMRDNISVGP